MIIRLIEILVIVSILLYYTVVIVQLVGRWHFILGDNGWKNFIPFYGLFVYKPNDAAKDNESKQTNPPKVTKKTSKKQAKK
ncbi:hypothetical protein FACS189464_4470 [Bacteroidia bacterium]|nr:hypothetical protein FACS189464_4470 [Bacteroidia bacterium]